jgi:DNA repair exonuclease SbcCD ATPase subunit
MDICKVYWDDLSYQLNDNNSNYSIQNVEGLPFKITWDNSEHIMSCPSDIASLNYARSLENRIEQLEGGDFATKNFTRAFVGYEVDKAVTPIQALVGLINTAIDAIKGQLTQKSEQSQVISLQMEILELKRRLSSAENKLQNHDNKITNLFQNDEQIKEQINQVNQEILAVKFKQLLTDLKITGLNEKIDQQFELIFALDRQIQQIKQDIQQLDSRFNLLVNQVNTAIGLCHYL